MRTTQISRNDLKLNEKSEDIQKNQRNSARTSIKEGAMFNTQAECDTIQRTEGGKSMVDALTVMKS